MPLTSFDMSCHRGFGLKTSVHPSSAHAIYIFPDTPWDCHICRSGQGWLTRGRGGIYGSPMDVVSGNMWISHTSSRSPRETAEQPAAPEPEIALG